MSYSSLACAYDKLTFNVEYEKRAEYITELLRKNGCSQGILLDLACGTGVLSHLIAKNGYDMILVDSSPEMLYYARERMPNALILCQDMTELDLFGTIKGTVCSLDGINHLLKPIDVKKTFGLVSLFTEKGGVFVFDINTPYKHENVLGNNTFVYEKDDIYLVWQNTFRKKSCKVDINLDIFTKQDNTYCRNSESFSERAYEIDDICAWLVEAGFAVTGIYDDMTFESPNDTSQRVYISAVKL